jgi:hypothetical protein
MKITPEINFTLTIISGLCWTITYILIIYRSIKDKTYGMPFWALAFNISWEFIFSIIFVFHDPNDLTQLVVNRIWLLFDVFIIVTYFMYGRKEWPVSIPQKWFYPYSVLVLIISFGFVYLFSVTFHNKNGMYIAFIQNMMMSWLFIAMRIKRNSLAGQSLGIAIFKMFGTLAPTLLYCWDYPFIMFLGLNCFVADCIYIAMIWKRKVAIKAQEIDCKDCNTTIIPMGQ